MSKDALLGIAEDGHEAASAGAWWFEPFGLISEKIFEDILPEALKAGRPAVSCNANQTFIPFPLQPGEPEGILLTWPAPRAGLAMLAVSQDAQYKLAALWPFVTEGVQHEARIDRVLLAPDRLQAVIEGSVGGVVALAWNDVFFPIDRGYYAKGSVHEVLLAGIAHEFDLGAMPPIRIMPDAPSYAIMREAHSGAVAADGAVEINTDNLTAIYPASPSAPTMHSIHGPVKSVGPCRYTGELLGRKIWEIRMTVARIGDTNDTDFDLAVFVTDVVLKGRALPKVGETVRGVVRLQARIWQPNVASIG